jgi:hypothetical protein
MTDPSFTDEADRDLLVVLPTREDAEEAARRLLDAGIAADDVLVGRETDRMASLRAEMHGELSDAWIVPNAGVAYTKEAGRGLVLGSVVGVAVGVVAAFALALIPIGDTTYGARLVVFLLVGIAFGFTIGLVAGPSLGSVRPGQAPAVERGTLLRVRHDSAALRRLLAELHPIRMDEIRRVDDLPLAAVATEEGPQVEQTAQDVGRNLRGDDYHPDPDQPDEPARPTEG